MRALLFAAAAALAACSQTVELGGGGAGANDLHGEWIMASRVLRPPTMTLADDGGSGFAGCNRWFSQYARDGESLAFSDIGATRMACEQPAMTIESNFLSALERTRAAHIDGDRLTLLDADGVVTVRFLRAR